MCIRDRHSTAQHSTAQHSTGAQYSTAAVKRDIGLIFTISTRYIIQTGCHCSIYDIASSFIMHPVPNSTASDNLQQRILQSTRKGSRCKSKQYALQAHLKHYLACTGTKYGAKQGAFASAQAVDSREVQTSKTIKSLPRLTRPSPYNLSTKDGNIMNVSTSM